MSTVHVQFSKSLLLTVTVAFNVFALPVISTTSSKILIRELDSLYQLSDPLLGAYRFSTQQRLIPQSATNPSSYASYAAYNASKKTPIRPTSSGCAVTSPRWPLWSKLLNVTTYVTTWAPCAVSVRECIESDEGLRHVMDIFDDNNLDWDLDMEDSPFSNYEMKLAEAGIVEAPAYVPTASETADVFSEDDENLPPVQPAHIGNAEIPLQEAGSATRDSEGTPTPSPQPPKRISIPLEPTPEEIEGMKGHLKSTLRLRVGPLRTPAAKPNSH